MIDNTPDIQLEWKLVFHATLYSTLCTIADTRDSFKALWEARKIQNAPKQSWVFRLHSHLCQVGSRKCSFIKQICFICTKGRLATQSHNTIWLVPLFDPLCSSFIDCLAAWCIYLLICSLRAWIWRIKSIFNIEYLFICNFAVWRQVA